MKALKLANEFGAADGGASLSAGVSLATVAALCAAVGPPDRKNQHLRCCARSVRKYQWLSAGAAEFGAVRQSAAEANAVVGRPPLMTKKTRKSAPQSAEAKLMMPTGRGIGAAMWFSTRCNAKSLLGNSLTIRCQCGNLRKLRDAGASA
jgi:hypothetical protein